MSDFFIGQLLVFAMLIPVLLRPYIKALRDLEGIPLLAPLSAAVCLGTAAAGLRILFFPLFAFALAALFSQVPLLISMARKLPSDAPQRGPSAFSAVALAILAALAIVCAYFQPEFSYLPKRDVRASTERASLSAGFRYRFNIFEGEEETKGNVAARDLQESGSFQSSEPLSAIILYFPSFPSGLSGRDTLLTMAAERGFEAIAVHWSGKNLYSSSSMNPEALRDLRQVAYAIGQSFKQEGTEAQYVTRFARSQEGVMQTVILDAARFALERSRQKAGKSARLFAVAEGYACTSLAAVVSARPELFAGAVYLLQEEDAMNLSISAADSARLRALDEAMPDSAADFAQIAITDARKGALGFCEMPAEDPALAALLKIERDKGRRIARLVAERTLYWIEMRNGRLQGNP